MIQVKFLFDLLDCYGILLISRYKSNVDNKFNRILAIAIGWGFMDAVVKYLFTFIFNATGYEFTWAYILKAISANLEFVKL